MKILALNCGSSTVKLQLFETSRELMARDEDRVLAQGSVERIGMPDATITFKVPGADVWTSRKEIRDHRGAIQAALDYLINADHGLVRDTKEIDGIGHRMVHAGEHYSQSVLINDDVVRRVEECNSLAPLHNPHNLTGYYAVRDLLPHCRHVAVFDTAFHQTIPPRAFLYGLPYELYGEHKIRRYGFHGTSHRYVCNRFAQIHGAGPEDFKLITCHLGSGSSMCAIDSGRSVDVTLGFTPLEGLMMGTRPGDLDPGVLLHLMSTQNLTVDQAGALLNNRSGLLGLSGITNDMRVLVAESQRGNQRARLAIEVFCYRIRKYMGAYFAVLNGIDAVIFTGGIGENAPLIRAQCCESLDSLGVMINSEKNESAIGVETEISPEEAETKVWVIPTNEELLIARETVLCIHADTPGN